MDLKSVTLKGRKHEVRKRIARGLGSGLGKTAGRGHKGWGQRSGASRRPGYEGGQMPLYRRVPKRGFTNARFRTDYTVINVDLLESFEAGATVDLEAVLERGLTRKEAPLFKVLGNGELSHALTVRAQKFSKSAADKIRAAGARSSSSTPRAACARPGRSAGRRSQARQGGETREEREGRGRDARGGGAKEKKPRRRARAATNPEERGARRA
jgi:large subunit ribosomal protein L15